MLLEGIHIVFLHDLAVVGYRMQWHFLADETCWIVARLAYPMRALLVIAFQKAFH